MLNEETIQKLQDFVYYKFHSFWEEDYPTLPEALERTHIDLEETFKDLPLYYFCTLDILRQLYMKKSTDLQCRAFQALQAELQTERFSVPIFNFEDLPSSPVDMHYRIPAERFRVVLERTWAECIGEYSCDPHVAVEQTLEDLDHYLYNQKDFQCITHEYLFKHYQEYVQANCMRVDQSILDLLTR